MRNGVSSEALSATTRHATRTVMIRSLLCDGPCHGGVSHTPFPCDRPGTLALGDTLTSYAPLQVGQLRLATHMHPTLACSSSAVIGTLHDPLALVLRQGAEERDETATDGGGEVQMGLVENLDHGTPCVDPLDDVYAIHHRPRGAIPFGDHEHVTPAERIDSLLELRAALDRLA